MYKSFPACRAELRIQCGKLLRDFTVGFLLSLSLSLSLSLQRFSVCLVSEQLVPTLLASTLDSVRQNTRTACGSVCCVCKDSTVFLAYFDTDPGDVMFSLLLVTRALGWCVCSLCQTSVLQSHPYWRLWHRSWKGVSSFAYLTRGGVSHMMRWHVMHMRVAAFVRRSMHLTRMLLHWQIPNTADQRSRQSVGERSSTSAHGKEACPLLAILRACCFISRIWYCEDARHNLTETAQ